jgi:hypothetical protein
VLLEKLHEPSAWLAGSAVAEEVVQDRSTMVLEQETSSSPLLRIAPG